MEKIDSVKETTLKSMIWSFMDTFGSKGIHLLIQLFLARLLIPSDFGVLGIVYVFILISTVFVDSGFTNGLLRDKDSSQKDYSTVFIFNLATATLFYTLLFVSAGPISRFFETPQLTSVIRVLGTVLICDAISLIQRIQLTKKSRFDTQMKINISSSLLSGLIAIVLAFMGFGIWSLVGKRLLAQFFQAILYTYANRWMPTLIFSPSSFKRLFTFGWKLLVSRLLSVFYENLYALIIGRGFSMASLGFYTNAQKLSTSASYSIESSVEKVSYPLLSRLQDDGPKLKAAFQKTFKHTVFITFPTMMILAAVAPPLFRLVLGENWLPAIPFFQIMCLAGLFTPLHSLNLSILQVKGRSDLFLKLSLIGNLIATVIVGLVLLLDLGIMGLLWGLVLDYFISYFNNAYYTKKLIAYSILDQLKDIRRITLISTGTAISVYALNFVVISNDFFLITTQLVVSSVLYLTLSYLLKVKELNTIYQIVQPIQRKFLVRKSI